MKPTPNGLNGSPAHRMSFKECMNRRDELDAMQVTDPESYAWEWMKLAADFDAMGFTGNAERCRDKGEAYFQLAPVGADVEGE